VKRLMILALCATLAACGTDGCPPPTPQIKPVEVDKIVATPCVDKGSIANEPIFDRSRLTHKAKHDILIVSDEEMKLRTWGEGMHAQLIGCAK